MQRFPKFELSYETVSHKKDHYDSCLAIPVGKKAFAWFTYEGENDVCYLADLNRDKKITTLKKVENIIVPVDLAIGTVLYGTIVAEEEDKTPFFVVEDIYYYQGYPVKHACFLERMDMIRIVLDSVNPSSIHFVMPVIWSIHSAEPTAGYPVHHHQYRSTYKIMPYLNVFINKKITAPVIEEKKKSTFVYETIRFRKDFNKPQYRYPATFQVTADIQYDIYHLYAFGRNNLPVYYDVAYIPNCKTSVFMNQLFRNIRENTNLDYIEESDDEDDFQNIDADKYVDVNKVLLIECSFHTKFRRWVPIRVMPKYTKTVHIQKLM